MDGNDVKYSHEQCPKEDLTFKCHASGKVDANATPQEKSTNEFKKQPITKSKNNLYSLESLKEKENGINHLSVAENNNNYEKFFEVEKL